MPKKPAPFWGQARCSWYCHDLGFLFKKYEPKNSNRNLRKRNSPTHLSSVENHQRLLSPMKAPPLWGGAILDPMAALLKNRDLYNDSFQWYSDTSLDDDNDHPQSTEVPFSRNFLADSIQDRYQSSVENHQ